MGNSAINYGTENIIIPYGVKTLEGMGGARTKTISIASTVGNITTGQINRNELLVFCSKYSPTELFCKQHEISYIIDQSVDNEIQVVYDGMRISFDTPPIIENGRTLVALRAIFEKIGANIVWDGDNQIITATKDNDTIKLQIGSNKLYINDEEKVIDVPAQLVGGRTLVPARAVAESFDCIVNWIDYANIVEIKSK